MGNQNDFDWIIWERVNWSSSCPQYCNSHQATLATASDANSAAADTLVKETGGIFAFKKCK